MRRLAAALLLAAAAAPLAAHHSISGVYDSAKQVTLTGSVREFAFVNPHPWIRLDVPGDDGRLERWRLELDNRWELVDVGMKADTFRTGDMVVARGSAGRDGARAIYVLRLDRAADGLYYEQVGQSPKLRFAH